MTHEVGGHAIPHFKAKINDKYETGMSRHSSNFILCQAIFKNSVLLHTKGLMPFVWIVVSVLTYWNLLCRYFRFFFLQVRALESLAFLRSQPKMSGVLAPSWQRPASFTPGCVHHKLPVANRQPVNKPHYWSPFSLIYGCCAVHYSSGPYLTSVKWNITFDTRSSV